MASKRHFEINWPLAIFYWNPFFSNSIEKLRPTKTNRIPAALNACATSPINDVPQCCQSWFAWKTITSQCYSLISQCYSHYSVFFCYYSVIFLLQPSIKSTSSSGLADQPWITLILATAGLLFLGLCSAVFVAWRR